MTDINELSLRNITPQNLVGDEDISALISAIDPQLQQISLSAIEPLIMARIDELPENVLDLLAWQFHTDFYDLAGNIEMKRKAVKNSVLWHMHKGTEWAIHEGLRQIDITADFIPWWEENAEPYTFRLDALVTGDFYRTKGVDKLQSSIRRVVEESKSARSYLSDLKVRIEFHDDMSLYAGIATALQGEQRILLAHDEDIPTNIYVGIVTIEDRDIELGVDLDEMQELLRRFEERILRRIDEYERNLTLTLTTQQAQINLQLEEIKDMLRWKGADEVS